jgi:hypothetical protein
MMSYALSALSHRAQVVSRRGLAITVIAALALPAHHASAQLGGLVKKARDKAVEQQVEKRVGGSAASGADAAPKFDDVTVELTADRVAGIVRGLAAGRAVLDGANGAPGRAALVARRDEAATKSEGLASANEKLFSAYVEKRDISQRCRNDAMYASREKRQKATEERNKQLSSKAMTDPAFREKAIAIAQKMGVAQQKGDTAEIRRLSAELGVGEDDPKPDTLAADKACGREPAKPPAMVQSEQLNAQASALSDQIRQLEEKAATTEIKESGLNERQFLMARERIEAYLSSLKYKSQPRGFSKPELDALGARRGDLEKAM